MVTDVANENDVGPESLRGVCFIERVEDPTLLGKNRGASGKEMPQE